LIISENTSQTSDASVGSEQTEVNH